MKIFNIKLKHYVYAYTAFILIALYGCGDTSSMSASGQGRNAIAEGDITITDTVNEKDIPDGGGTIQGVRSVEGGHLPAHCSIVFEPVEPVIGCSVSSYAECICYDPTNPAQAN